MIKTAISYFIIDWCIDIFFDRIDKNISGPVRSLSYDDNLSYDHTKLSKGDRVTVTVSDDACYDVVYTTLVDATVVSCDSVVLILTYSTVVYDIDCGSSDNAEKIYLSKDISGLSIAEGVVNDRYIILGRDGHMISILVNYDLKHTGAFYVDEICSVELMIDSKS